MSPGNRSQRVVHGDDLLYRFFQDALRDHPELFSAVPQLLVTTMGIWLPLDAYQRWPVMLPWVVRDASCRGNPRAGTPDEWSAPDARGYLRDDNSLIKALPRVLAVRGPAGSHVNGARMGTEFVACHIWRTVRHDDLASRIPLLNSFVPNLVWLPSQISKLSDREAGIVQRTLQAMSYRIYRDAPVEPHLREAVDEAWSMIPQPDVEPTPFELGDLNWFQPTDGFYRTRLQRLGAVVEALASLERNQPIPSRVVTTRYAAGLRSVKRTERRALSEHLQRFVQL
jgi:hypothetical protein